MPWKKGESGNPGGGEHPMTGAPRALARSNALRAVERLVAGLESEESKTWIPCAREICRIAGVYANPEGATAADPMLDLLSRDQLMQLLAERDPSKRAALRAKFAAEASNAQH